jgi:TatD-related deoxyribonuclease
MSKYPVLDNHIHLDPNGLNLEAAKRFEHAGGTHLIVSHKPYRDCPIKSAEDYKKAFDMTVGLVDNVNKNTGVKAFSTLGPYPVELLSLVDELGLEAAKDVLMKGMDLAKEYVLEKKAIAIGEVGRPHFEVDEDVLDASNEIMGYGMKLAHEAGCPIVLHTESAKEPDHVPGLLEIAKPTGISNEMIIKHFSPHALADPEVNMGITPSIVARRQAMKKALRRSNNLLMETDYMDTLERPDMVLPPEAIPEVLKEYLQKDIMSVEDVFHIHKDLPERLYGIQIEY